MDFVKELGPQLVKALRNRRWQSRTRSRRQVTWWISWMEVRKVLFHGLRRRGGKTKWRKPLSFIMVRLLPVARAEAVELDRVIASLPPEGYMEAESISWTFVRSPYGGAGWSPQSLLEGDDLPDVLPRPKVRVTQGELVARTLYDWGIVAPTDQAISIPEFLSRTALLACHIEVGWGHQYP